VHSGDVSEPVTLSVGFSDSSGPVAPQAVLRSATGTVLSLGQGVRTGQSGNAYSYEWKVTLPPRSGIALWTAEVGPLEDVKGNRAEAVSVISGRLDARLPAVDDKEAPVTTGFDFSPKLVDVTQGARSVQIAVRVTDTIGVPPSSVAWQLNHETAGLSMVGDYMTLASGNDRDGVYRGEIQVMDPPSNVKAEPFETGGARVTWTPPSVTDPRLSTRYMVTAHPSGATQTVASTTATFTGLPLGEDFTFDVVAVNDAGSSAAGTSNAVRSSIPVKGSVTFVDRCGASGDYFEIP